MNDDPFWVDDPLLLIRPDRIVEFYPSLDMSGNERMNAITRFVVYAGALITFFKKRTPMPMSVALAIAATIAVLYYPKADKSMLNVYYANNGMYRTEQACMAPNENNPYMNLMPEDAQWSEKRNLPPCEIDQSIIEKSNPSDPNDIYKTQNSERQFYTVSRDTPQFEAAPSDMGAHKNADY